MELKDIFLGPLYLFVIFFFAFLYKVRLKDPILKKYFIPALGLKILGAIALGCIYQFYYKGGDTFMYFTHGSRYIWNAFIDSPITAFKLLFERGGEFDADTIKYSSRIYFYPNPATYFVVKISALFGFLCFHSYIVVAMFFGIFSFTGIWRIFLVFYRKYPHLHKELALGIFFLPSLIFWGSGILKDSLTLGALGWFFYGFHNYFIVKKNRWTAATIMLVAFYIIKVVKIYIIISFIPAGVIWLFMTYSESIKSRTARAFLKPILFLFASAMGTLAGIKISEDNARYNVENIGKTAQTTAEWIKYSSIKTKSSTYDLGDSDYSAMGMLKKMPKAIWVTLFRPYIWESRNVVMLLSALESLYIFFITVMTFKKIGIVKTFSIIRNNAIISFSLIFALTFAFGVGISTQNFGSLVRYKIPLLPFYIVAVYLIRDAWKKEKFLIKMKREYSPSSTEIFTS